MKKIFYVLILISFAFKQSDNKVIWQEIRSGRNSGIHETDSRMITDLSDLHRLNNDLIKRDYLGEIEVNEVDFNRQSLVVYFAGSNVNAIKMDSAKIVNNTLLIYIDRIEFSRGCYEATLLVTPYIVLKIDKGNWKTYEIRTSVSTRICDEK